MTKRGVPAALWAAAAVGATAIATIVITASVGGGTPTLSPDEVARALGTTTAGATTTGTGTTAPTVTSTSGTAGGEVFGTVPGTVTIRCDGGLATLVSWSPNPGYRVDEVVRGPVAKASVWFESDTADDVLIVGTCVDGTPTVTEVPEGKETQGTDDHGGDNSGPGGGNSGPGGGRDHPEDY
jgi:hypothetical protein